MSPSFTGKTIVQGFGIPDGLKEFGGDIKDGLGDAAKWTGDRVEDGVEWAGDRVEDLKDLGEDAFPEMVERLSPELAALMRDGSLGMIRDEIESGLEGWVESALGSTNIDEAVVGFQEDFSSIFTELQTAAEDGGEDCQAFVGKLDGIRSVIERLSESDAVQNLQDVFSSVTSGVQKVLDLLIAPVFDTAMEIAGGVLNGVTEFAQNIWQWGKPIRDVLGKAWDWVLGKLGIGGDGEGGILNWVKEKAATIWTEIQERFAPVIEPMRKVVGVVIAFSPVGLLMGAVKFAPQIIESIQWLWENKDNPNIVKDAHEEMGHTILPKLLSGAEGLSNGFQSVIEPFTTQLAQIGESLLSLMSAVSGVPLLNGATEFFQSISENIENLKKASVEKFQSAVESTKQFSQKVQEKLAPYAEVLSSLGVALVNPAMIPTILAGNAWLALPDCYQGAIIDVILDALIAILSTASEIPAFGPLWSLLQTGILGFLEGLRGQATDVKVQISQKIAKIISGRSLDFILGFVKGVLKGIWEGLSDPFVLMY
jgi:hypothetical protein